MHCMYINGKGCGPYISQSLFFLGEAMVGTTEKLDVYNFEKWIKIGSP